MKKLLALVTLALLSTDLFATSYYVNSATGSDANPGTSAAPFQSFSKLNQITISPGDTIYFARGTTYTGYFEFLQSGAAGLPITFTSYGTGAAPIFNNPNEWYAIRLTGNYLVVDGVMLRDTYESGIVIWGSNCVVQNCEMTNTGFGVMIAAVNAKVYNNHIHDLHMIVNTPGGDDDYGANGINVTTNTNGADISYNIITGCIAPSYDYGMDGGAIEFYGNVSNVNFHHNWCEGNNGIFEMGGGAISNVKMYYNVCLNNGEMGGVHLAGGFAATITSIRVENNTVVDNYTGVSNGVIWFDGTSRQNQFSITNNIFHYNGFSQFTNGTRFVHKNNLYFPVNNAPLGFRAASTEIVADPKFTNLGTKDFTLQATSPAINAGVALGYTADYLNHPIVGLPDLGAYERP